MQVSKPKKNKSLRHKIYFALFIVFAGLVISACVSTITVLSQESSAKPGDTAHMVINLQWAGINYDDSYREVVGICVPKSWNAARNTTMTYKSDVGDGKMIVIPDGVVEPTNKLPYPASFLKKFGIGPNYINDMEWVVFWSDVNLRVSNGSTVNGQIYINIKTSQDNVSFKPGYVMCEDKDGISDYFTGLYTSLFGNCMQVVAPDAEEIEDFCNPQIGTADPANATYNDIVTITYNGSLDTSALKNGTDVYFCAKGYTTSGEVIDMCQQTEQTKLTPSGIQQWRIDFWPKKFFNLQNGQSLSKIEYYFTNKDGTMKTGYGNTTDPFKYTFKCK